MDWMNKLSNWFKGFFKSPSPPDPTERLIQKLMLMLEHTRTEEASCDDVYDILDQYTEMVSRGEDAATLLPLIKHHLDMCPECQEEYNALLRIVEATPS